MSDIKNAGMHKIFIDYPLNAANLKYVEESVAELTVSIGDVVVVDCNGMDYICSSGLRTFLQLYKDVASRGGKLIIRNLQPLVKGVFVMSGFVHIFNIEED